MLQGPQEGQSPLPLAQLALYQLLLFTYLITFHTHGFMPCVAPQVCVHTWAGSLRVHESVSPGVGGSAQPQTYV